STPVSEWSYIGFLEALKANCVYEEQDGISISKEHATFLIQQKRPSEEENFWNSVKTEKDLMVKEDIFDKQLQIDALNVLEATRNQKTEEYIDKMAKGKEVDTSFGDEELPSTSSKK
ncbi:1549_t:CDS:2, partial [Funneliformis geosporum]